MNELVAGLDSWIIQDGNYGDFQVGESCRLALAFNGTALRPSAARVMRCEPVRGSFCNVVARIVFSAPKVWVVDFGVKAYCEARPPRFANVGDWVEGEIWVGVDPFFYMDRLHRMPGMPDLFIDWHVTRIRLETTPWVEETSGGQTRLRRDVEHEAWVDKNATDAGRDDEGRGHYLLSLSKATPAMRGPI
ncbi:hypothetical protein HT746_22885 [Burkholderia pyrrocinia]|uniref:hypothetical protein n=1 Tax=Burkholderia pyrrocinia TaxID=60550 RepID=UPI0015751BA4|nr:hypothetical protein [Burkholderia pyrrocinia]NTX29928.1 hypothetical protein [Burkholderia pyrrocinia]